MEALYLDVVSTSQVGSESVMGILAGGNLAGSACSDKGACGRSFKPVWDLADLADTALLKGWSSSTLKAWP